MKYFFRFISIFASLFFVSSAFAADSSPATAAVDVKAPSGIENNPLIKNAPLKTDFVLGKKDAKVTIVEYASLSCSHCAAFANDVLPEIEKKYIDTGAVRYVLRQFPLNEPAFGGAMLVDCVGKKDSAKYYLFAKVLFAEQAKWAFDMSWKSGLEKFAAVGGVSKAEFEACLADKDRESRVLQGKKEAMDELKVPHTPFFYIDGEIYDGDRSFLEISKAIEAKLAKKIDKK